MRRLGVEYGVWGMGEDRGAPPFSGRADSPVAQKMSARRNACSAPSINDNANVQRRTGEQVHPLNGASRQSSLTLPHSPFPRPHRATGFTFFEVLSALVLAAIVLPVALQGISIAMSLASNSRTRLEAMRLAEDKMNELLITGFEQSDELDGDFEDLGKPDVYWYAVLEDYEGTTLREMKLWVYYEHHGKERWVSLSTLLYEAEE